MAVVSRNPDPSLKGINRLHRAFAESLGAQDERPLVVLKRPCNDLRSARASSVTSTNDG